MLGIGTEDGSGFAEELELLSLVGASATAFAATTRAGEAPCCSWERDEEAATRVEEEEEEEEASKDERTRGERIGGASGDDLLLETAAAARPVDATRGSDIALSRALR